MTSEKELQDSKTLTTMRDLSIKCSGRELNRKPDRLEQRSYVATSSIVCQTAKVSPNGWATLTSISIRRNSHRSALSWSVQNKLVYHLCSSCCVTFLTILTRELWPLRPLGAQSPKFEKARQNILFFFRRRDAGH